MKKFVCLYDLKGWYCGNKTQSINYRTKKNAPLEEHEWVMYPNPSIPTIVPDALFQRSKSYPIVEVPSRWGKSKTNDTENLACPRRNIRGKWRIG